jgi:hypothetical protein
VIKKLCQCIGLSAILLVMNYGDLLGGGEDVRFHVPFGLSGIVSAQIADIFILALFILLLLTALRRTRYYGWVKLLIAIVIPPYILDRMQALSHLTMREGFIPIVAVLWGAFLLLLLTTFPAWYRRLLRAGDMAGVFLAAFALLSILQLLWVAHWKPGPQQRTAVWSSSPQPPRVHPRLVWIVFDELSHDQVFDHRAHDLQLPNFDALRSQSTIFTNTQPIGYKTVKIIPSLLTGKPVDDFRYRFDNSFIVRNTGEQDWHKVTGQQTVFHDAQQNGWRTAVVGWYNPYCGVYGDSIDQCYWMNRDSIDGLMSQGDSFWRNTYSPLQQMVREIKAPTRAGRDACTYDVRHRHNTHVDLEQHATQLLKTDQADFIFFHFSVPHSPNIWSRMNDHYTNMCDSSYLDNLDLADHLLGNLMQTLKTSPRWKDTTVIVEGDHSWRIDLWNSLPSWTDEDDAASHEFFDSRPALLVHQAGQTQPQTESAPWPLIKVHDVVEQVITGHPVHF